jgi:hypothetical protein
MWPITLVDVTSDATRREQLPRPTFLKQIKRVTLCDVGSSHLDMDGIKVFGKRVLTRCLICVGYRSQGLALVTSSPCPVLNDLSSRVKDTCSTPVNITCSATRFAAPSRCFRTLVKITCSVARWQNLPKPRPTFIKDIERAELCSVGSGQLDTVGFSALGRSRRMLIHSGSTLDGVEALRTRDHNRPTLIHSGSTLNEVATLCKRNHLVRGIVSGTAVRDGAPCSACTRRGDHRLGGLVSVICSRVVR